MISSTTALAAGSVHEVVVLVGIVDEVEQLARAAGVLVDDQSMALGLERRRSPSSR